MPSVSICPACKENIAIPDGVADDAALRCPLCQAQFSPGDVALAATPVPPMVVLVDAPSEPTAPESEDPLAAEVESLRSKTEAFQGSADPSSDDPANLQVQADQLGQEAQALLTHVGQWTYEAKEAEVKAMALVSRAMEYRKSTGNVLGSLADALEAVARSVEDKCDSLRTQLGESSAAVEDEPAEEPVQESTPSDATDEAPNPFGFLQQSEPASEEEEVATHEEEPASSATADDIPNPFAFLQQSEDGDKEEGEEDLVVEETEESPPAEEPNDPFAFLIADRGTEEESESAEEGQVSEDEVNALASEQDLTLEESEPPAVEDAETAPEPLDSAPSEVSDDAPGIADTEDKDEQLELAVETPATEEAEEAGETADVESLRTQLDTLLRVASALKAKAAELREEASSLFDESAEYTVQGEVEEGWGNSSWQPDGESAAAFSFGEEGATPSGTSGRAVRPGRRKKETSFVKELIGIVLGGAGGLLIAYYGLNFFGGVRYDFAKIYLPGVKHTVKHQPAWWPTWARFEGSDDVQEETGAESTWEEATIAQPPAPVEQKTPKASKAPKASQKAKSGKQTPKQESKRVPELPSEPAFAPPPELPSQPDLMTSPDLAPTSDLSAPPELSVSPDLSAPSEMSISPDLTAPSSVTLSPELMGMPSAKPEAPKEEPKAAPEEQEPAEPAPVMPEDEKPEAAEKETPKPAPAKDTSPKDAAAKDVSETPKPKASATSVSFVDLKQPPKYAAADLANALKEFPEDLGCPKCNSTGKVDDGVCPECQGQPPVAYSEFCRLGEMLAFVDPQSESLDARQAEARQLLEKAGSNPGVVKEIGRLSVALLEDEERPAPGILFAGTVVEINGKGQLQAAKIKLAGVERTIKVVSKEPMELAAKDRVLVSGCLVKNGSANGADTAPALFVWRGLVVKFAK